MVKIRNHKLFPQMGVNKSIGIDLGTANTLVYLNGKGIVLQEPSVVAIEARTKQILAVGVEAKEMIGRTPANIIAIRPLKEGVIADFDTTKSMLRYFINKALKGRTIWKPRVLVSVPLGITQVEKRAVIEAATQAGAKEAYVIEEPVAAAIGAGLVVEEPVGRMIVDIGGGTTEVAIISLGGVVKGRSLRIGGDAMNEAVVRYLRKEYNLDVGETTAERIKIEFGSALPVNEAATSAIRGRSLATGLPVEITIKRNEIYQALKEPITAILDSIKMTLEQTPPELASDVIDQGVLLVGGGAMLNGLDQLVSNETHIPVKVSTDPLTAVVRGCGKALEQLSILKKVAIS